MANVWYIGDAHIRSVFNQIFSIANGWSVPDTNFTPAQLIELDADQGFLLGQTGPRVSPPWTPDSTPDPGWPYYDAIKRMHDRLIATGTEEPVENFEMAMGIGSSTMGGMSTRMATALAAYGVGFSATETAQGGWNLSLIAASIGVRPLIVDACTIPASGPVAVVPLNMNESTTSQYVRWPGTLAGIPGSLVKASGTTVWNFTRATPGVSTVVAKGTSYQPSAATAHKGSLAFINSGKNTLTSTAAGWGVDRVIQLTDKIVDHFSNGRAIVIGHFVNSATTPTHVSRARITAANDAHRAKYGDRFFDLQAYLMGTDVWTETGITPTAEDLAEQQAGNKPPSLSSDAGHMNGPAYLAVVNRLVSQARTLGWLPPALPVPPGTKTIIATEDFNKPDGTIVGKKTTTGDLTWALPTGSASSVGLPVVNNQAATPGGVKRAILPTPGPNHRVTVKITAMGDAPAERAIRVLCRVTDQTTYYFASPRRTATDGGLSIWKSVAGNLTSIFSTGSVTPAIGDDLSCEAEGDQIRVYVNGELKGTATDSALITGNAVGIEILSNAIGADDLVLESITRA